MKRRRVILFAALLVGGVLPVLLLSGRGGIAQTSADNIVPGMSLEEIQALIGKPPGNYTTWLADWHPHGALADIQRLLWRRPPGTAKFYEWLCDTGYLVVHVDEADRVITSDFIAIPNPIASRARRWLGTR